MPLNVNPTDQEDDEVPPAYPGGLVPHLSEHSAEQVSGKELLLFLIIGGLSVLAAVICGAAAGLL